MEGRGQRAFDIAEMPFPDQYFGLMFCCHVMPMLPRARLLMAVRECFRVLAPGGIAIIESPVKDGATIEMEHNTEAERQAAWYSGDVLRIFGDDEYWPMFEAAGFRVVERPIASEADARNWRLYQTTFKYFERPAAPEPIKTGT